MEKFHEILDDWETPVPELIDYFIELRERYSEGVPSGLIGLAAIHIFVRLEAWTSAQNFEE